MLPKNVRRKPSVEAVRADLKPYFKFAKRFFFAGLALEACLMTATYFGFRRLNESHETRQHLAKHYPFILEGYYYITDEVAGKNIREQDQALWSQTEISWKENEY